jgi:hypothetical protein
MFRFKSAVAQIQSSCYCTAPVDSACHRTNHRQHRHRLWVCALSTSSYCHYSVSSSWASSELVHIPCDWSHKCSNLQCSWTHQDCRSYCWGCALLWRGAPSRASGLHSLHSSPVLSRSRYALPSRNLSYVVEILFSVISTHSRRSSTEFMASTPAFIASAVSLLRMGFAHNPPIQSACFTLV